MWTFGNDGMFLLRVIQVISGSSFCVSGSAETVRSGLRSTCARTCGIDLLWSTNMKHQSISRWLSQLGLPQYCLVLEQEYDGVEVKLEKKKKKLHQLVETANIYLTIPPPSVLLRLVLTQYWVTPFTNWPKTDLRSNEDTFEASDNSFNHIVNIVFFFCFFLNFIGCLDFLSTFSFRSQTSAALVCCTAAVSLMPVNNCCYGDNAIRKPWSDPSIAITHACMVKRAHRE